MNDNRSTITPGLILIILGALFLFANSSAFTVLAILFGLLLLVRHFDNNTLSDIFGRAEGRDEHYDDIFDHEEEHPPVVRKDPVYRHALQAVMQAGLDPDEVQVLPVDIGVFAFKGEADPVVYRTWALPDDVDYIQPFVWLRLPTDAAGSIRFEIVDSRGRLVFAHEERHQLQRGRNLISPTTRLPIHDQLEMDTGWQLRIITDGVLLASHKFEFAEATSAAIRRHIGEDGEISTELKAALTESRLQDMTLDDLLAYDDGETAGRQQG